MASPTTVTNAKTRAREGSAPPSLLEAPVKCEKKRAAVFRQTPRKWLDEPYRI